MVVTTDGLYCRLHCNGGKKAYDNDHEVAQIPSMIWNQHVPVCTYNGHISNDFLNLILAPELLVDHDLGDTTDL